MGDLRSRALNFARKNADTWTGDDIDNLTALLAEVRAETEARVVEAAANECSDRSKRYTCTAIELEKLGHLSTGEEVRLEARMARECEQAIRALAPGDYVAVRREDFGVLAEAAEELEARIRMERAGYESSRADEIRAALSRARKGD